MTDLANYILKAFSSLRDLSIEQITQFGRNQSKTEIPIPSFDENLLINLCSAAKNVFMNENSILEIVGDSIIVGDIHGSLHDLLRILNYVGKNPYKVVFLGDYVDRGQFSLECIILLFSLKIMCPDKYFLLRGNHEFDAMCSLYGFKKEILNFHNPKKLYHFESEQMNDSPTTSSKNLAFDEQDQEKQEISTEELCDNYFANHININCYKYSEKLYSAFMRAFSFLPIAAVVNRASFCIHGGLTPLLDKIDKIEKQIQRPIDNYDENPLLCDLLWGDPTFEDRQLYNDNPRGRGKLFNGVVVVNFLKNNNLQRIIRAHECVYEGISEIFNDKCITVFSASSYSYDMSNSSGILKLFECNDCIEKVVFEPILRLKKFDAVYYKVQAFSNLKRFMPPIQLKSVAYFGLVDLLKDTDRVNLSKFQSGKKNGVGTKKFSFKTGVHSRQIKQCSSVPLNVSACCFKNNILSYREDERLCTSKSNDNLPALDQKE